MGINEARMGMEDGETVAWCILPVFRQPGWLGPGWSGGGYEV